MIKISFRRQADILDPSGTSGLDPIPGLQERNKRNLLDVLQAAQPIIAEMAKVKPETWRSMSGLFTALEGTFGTGVRTIGQGFLRPANMLQNRLMNTFEGFLTPVMVGLNSLSNQLESFALQNQVGATIGAGIGFIAGFKLPGGPLLWSMIGSFVGAGVEAGVPIITNPFDIIGNIQRYEAWLTGQTNPLAEQTAATLGEIVPIAPIGTITPFNQRRGLQGRGGFQQFG